MRPSDKLSVSYHLQPSQFITFTKSLVNAKAYMWIVRGHPLGRTLDKPHLLCLGKKTRLFAFVHAQLIRMSTRKITRESEEKKGSTFEGIIGLLLIGAFIWGGVTLFSESEPQYGYHRDEQIDYIIHAYNQVAENKLGEVSDSSQVTFGTGEAAVNIASPEDRVMFKIWREAEPEQALASVLKTADLFAKIVSPELTNEDLTVIHEALLTGKHNYYNMFDYKGVGYALIWRDVNGGLREYSFDLYADEINFEDTES